MHNDWMIFSEEAGEVTARQLAKKASVVMQFTGLHDKNGKEIYEGDVICYVDDVVVENIGGWDRTEPEGKFVEVKMPDIYRNEDLPPIEELEVIGNIYENPELIQQND